MKTKVEKIKEIKWALDHFKVFPTEKNKNYVLKLVNGLTVVPENEDE